MPRETIRKLADDIERVLVAGAHLAQADAGLSRDKTALEGLIQKLGAKAPPIFGKIAEQIDKAMTAPAKTQAGELITLTSYVSQVRSAQAQLAPAPTTLEPIRRVPPLGTPCNAHELYELHDALIQTGKGRLEKIQQAVERGDVADLRLVRAVIQAMGDGYIGNEVSDKVVPQFGRAVVDPILEKLKFPGKSTDGRRLRALVAVEKQASFALVERALREGSAELREAALNAIADHLPGVAELEPLILGVLEKERTGDVRRAAVRALKGYGSQAALDATLEAILDERTMRAAGEALGRSKHPNVVDRLLALLEEAAVEARARPKKDDKPGNAKKTLKKQLVDVILHALAELNDPRIPGVATGLLNDYGASAARAVIKSGTPEDLKAIALLLDGTDTDLFPVAVQAIRALPAEHGSKHLKALFTAKDRESKLGLARLGALSESGHRYYSYYYYGHRETAYTPQGEDWFTTLLDLSQTAPRTVAAIAVLLLGRMKDKRAVEPLIAILAREKKDDEYPNAILHALVEIGDRRALPAMLGRLEGQYRWYASRAVEELADVSTVAIVRELWASKSAAEAKKSQQVEYLLQRLERKFPGA